MRTKAEMLRIFPPAPDTLDFVDGVPQTLRAVNVRKTAQLRTPFLINTLTNMNIKKHMYSGITIYLRGYPGHSLSSLWYGLSQISACTPLSYIASYLNQLFIGFFLGIYVHQRLFKIIIPHILKGAPSLSIFIIICYLCYIPFSNPRM